MRLQHDRSRLDSQPFAWVFVRLSSVLPIHHLNSIHPTTYLRSVRNYGNVSLLGRIRKNRPSVLTAENRAHSRIDRTTTVFLEPMMNLGFVSVEFLARNTTKEKSRVDVFR